jgi:hypothetical protein
MTYLPLSLTHMGMVPRQVLSSSSLCFCALLRSALGLSDGAASRSRRVSKSMPSSDALEPIDDSILDTDLWAILSWMIEGVGAPWTGHDLEETGRL